jgi:hypothetical protein
VTNDVSNTSEDIFNISQMRHATIKELGSWNLYAPEEVLLFLKQVQGIFQLQGPIIA